MSVTKETAARNLNEFIERYGQEGFLKLFLTNYLFELILMYLHSKPRNEKDDTSYLFYVNFRGESYSADQIDNFKAALKKECARRAVYIVKMAKESGLLERLGEDPTKDPRISEQLDQVFGSIVKEVKW